MGKDGNAELSIACRVVYISCMLLTIEKYVFDVILYVKGNEGCRRED